MLEHIKDLVPSLLSHTFSLFLSFLLFLSLSLPPCSSTADGRGADVRRGLHGGSGVPAGHSDDCQLPAVSPTQALALRTTLHEPLQRGSDSG